jgi:type II secretory pathway pseudopilin PulG
VMDERLRDESGYTLIELLIAALVMVIVLGSVLVMFDKMSAGAVKSDKLTATQDSTQTQIDRMTRTLRNSRVVVTGGSAFTRATPLAVAFGTIGGLSGTGTTPGYVSYCVNPTAQVLYAASTTSTAASTADPGTNCPSTVTGWTSTQLATNVVNTTSSPLFTYVPSTTSPRAVDISLRVNGGTTATPRIIALRTTAAQRSVDGMAPALPASTITATCQSDGSALLSLNAVVDQSGSPINALVSTAAGVTLGSGTAVSVGSSLFQSGMATVQVTLTNALGLSQLFTKTVTC